MTEPSSVSTSGSTGASAGARLSPELSQSPTPPPNGPRSPWHRVWASVNGAVLFYSALPLPAQWPARFGRVALLAPAMGLGLGGVLAGLDLALGQTGVSVALASALVIFSGVALTGGLHVDGVMDTADGLAVMAPERRLAVMADSRTGAFGVMAAIALLTLKIMALATLLSPASRGFALVAAAAWGRWGQQWAIAAYPYLKAEGKGRLHQQALPTGWETLPGLGLLLGLTGVAVALGGVPWRWGLAATGVGLGGAMGLSHWLAGRLGGHTGDTYGAVVEWTEAMVLIVLSGF
ncbi:MAG: adenosylcobinamide-GDP ribazoletransferase [Cyanobacteria bacterium P01_A01_bin.105]